MGIRRRAIKRGEPTHSLLTTAQRRHPSSPFYTEDRAGSARETPRIEEEEKTTFQNLEGEALEEAQPLVAAQTLQGGKVSAERLGNLLPLEGKRVSRELTSKALQEPKHRCFGK